MFLCNYIPYIHIYTKCNNIHTPYVFISFKTFLFDIGHKHGRRYHHPQRTLHAAGTLAHPGFWESLMSVLQNLFQNNLGVLVPAGKGTKETCPTSSWGSFLSVSTSPTPPWAQTRQVVPRSTEDSPCCRCPRKPRILGSLRRVGLGLR